MLLLIFYYLFSFVLFQLNINLIYSKTQDSCITFKNSSTPAENICEDFVDDNTTIIVELNCFIRKALIMEMDECPRNYSHIFLTFPDNTIFERFFKENHEIIKNLFKNRTLLNTVTFHIVIIRDNLTEITWNYINSTLKINLQDYTELLVGFEQQNRDRILPVIGDDFPYYNNSLIKLRASCGNIQGTIIYHPVKNGTMVLEQNDCINKTYDIILSTTDTTVILTSELISTIASDTTRKITTPQSTEITSTVKVETTKEYQTTKLITNMSSPISKATLITISALSTMKTTTEKIISYTINMNLSSTQLSKTSDNTLLQYVLPSLVIFLICIAICTILMYHRQYKSNDTIDDDASILSELASTDISIIKNNTTTNVTRTFDDNF
ncbi:unnamed protein product [Adineta steineri]|uniref:Uncharacterized protein n=1 Tax=Adineta steineri TaxID=433720 RepID=A0A815F2I2_9BILA|nr:unnamed protein product [Adineta steineri]CAF1585070.1 unnamed protein product [Adineta steineri]